MIVIVSELENTKIAGCNWTCNRSEDEVTLEYLDSPLIDTS